MYIYIYIYLRVMFDRVYKQLPIIRAHKWKNYVLAILELRFVKKYLKKKKKQVSVVVVRAVAVWKKKYAFTCTSYGCFFPHRATKIFEVNSISEYNVLCIQRHNRYSLNKHIVCGSWLRVWTTLSFEHNVCSSRIIHGRNLHSTTTCYYTDDL